MNQILQSAHFSLSQVRVEPSEMKASISSIAFLACISASYPSSSVGGFGVSAFQLSGRSANSRPALLGYASTSSSTSTRNRYAPSSQLYESSTEGDDAVAEADAAMKSMSVDEQKEKIGNLVAGECLRLLFSYLLAIIYHLTILLCRNIFATIVQMMSGWDCRWRSRSWYGRQSSKMSRERPRTSLERRNTR